MGIVTIGLLLILLFLLLPKKPKGKQRFDVRGFDHNHIHKNGTRFDDYGYDYYGYDKDGYNRQGYNKIGKNAKGQYDRFFDTTSREEEGFYNPQMYPVALSTHARERLNERLGISSLQQMNKQALDAYRFGKSKRHIKKTSAYLIDEIEQRHQDGIVLIYKNYIYVFSSKNLLVTVYKNDKIPL